MDDDKLTGAGRDGIIPGHTLGWFRDEMLGACSAYFRQQAQAEATITAAQHRVAYLAKYPDPKNRPKAGTTAEEIAADMALDQFAYAKQFGYYNWGGPSFTSEAQSIENLPFILWTSLKVHNPKITLAETKSLISPENEVSLRDNLLELMGYDLGDAEKKARAPINRQTRPWASGTSIPSSANAESPEAKSNT